MRLCPMVTTLLQEAKLGYLHLASNEGLVKTWRRVLVDHSKVDWWFEDVIFITAWFLFSPIYEHSKAHDLVGPGPLEISKLLPPTQTTGCVTFVKGSTKPNKFITTTAIIIVSTESISSHDTSWIGNILWNYSNHRIGSIVCEDAVGSLNLWR